MPVIASIMIWAVRIHCEVYPRSCYTSHKQHPEHGVCSLLWSCNWSGRVTSFLRWSRFLIILACFSLFCCTSAYLYRSFLPQQRYLHKVNCLQYNFNHWATFYDVNLAFFRHQRFYQKRVILITDFVSLIFSFSFFSKSKRSSATLLIKSNTSDCTIPFPGQRQRLL